MCDVCGIAIKSAYLAMGSAHRMFLDWPCTEETQDTLSDHVDPYNSFIFSSVSGFLYRAPSHHY